MLDRRALWGVGLGVMCLALTTGCPGGKAQTVWDQYPQGTLQTSSDLTYWSAVSAPNVYGASELPYLLGSFEVAMDDGGCPKVSTSGSLTTWTGNCTAPDGTQWLGTLTYDGGTVAYKGFGYKQAQTTCDGGSLLTSFSYNGYVITAGTNDAGVSNFNANLTANITGLDDAGCGAQTFTAAYGYSGSQTGNTWNGSGKIGNSLRGQVSGHTQDEVVNNSICSTEAASGTTTIQAGRDTAVITYDGAISCDSTSTVTWTLNGTAMGTASGVSCSAGGPFSAGGLALVALGGLLLLRRRSRAPGSSSR